MKKKRKDCQDQLVTGFTVLLFLLLYRRPQQPFLLRKATTSTAVVNTLQVLLLITTKVFTFAHCNRLRPALSHSILTRATPSSASTLSPRICTSNQHWHMWLGMCITPAQFPAAVQVPRDNPDSCQLTKLPHASTANPCSCTPRHCKPQHQSPAPTAVHAPAACPCSHVSAH